MKPLTALGIVFVVLGLVAIAYQGATYTSRETVIDAGPLHVTTEREKPLPTTELGILAVAAGVAFVLVSVRKRAAARND